MEKALNRITRFEISSIQKSMLDINCDDDKMKEVQRKLKRTHAFRSALNTLIASEIPFWVLKGIELSMRNYGDPMVRLFGDLDILISDRQQLGELRKFLLNQGWNEKYSYGWFEDSHRRNWYLDLIHHYSFIDPVNNILVEVHLELDPRFLKLEENMLKEILEKETTVIQIFNSPIKVLKPELEFVYLLAHATRHAWSSFKWLLDLYHFPKHQMDDAKLEYWIKFFRMKKAYHLYQDLTDIYFNETYSASKNKDSYLLTYSRKRIEYPEFRLPSGIRNKLRYYLFNILLIRDFKDFGTYFNYRLISGADVFQVNLPFRFLYYFYRPIGFWKRKFVKAE